MEPGHPCKQLTQESGRAGSAGQLLLPEFAGFQGLLTHVAGIQLCLLPVAAGHFVVLNAGQHLQQVLSYQAQACLHAPLLAVAAVADWGYCQIPLHHPGWLMHYHLHHHLHQMLPKQVQLPGAQQLRVMQQQVQVQ
jgi:hypothetical protein